MLKWKEAMLFDIVRIIAVASASWLMLSSMLLFAQLPDLRHLIRGSSHSRVGHKKSELPRTQVQTLRIWYWEARTDLRHQTICLFFLVL